MDRFPWSSHRGYLSVAKKWDWIYKRYVFQLLSKDKTTWIKRYRQHMSQEDDPGLSQLMESKKWPSVLGAKAFTDWIKGQYYHRKDNSEIAQGRELAPEPEEILSAVYDAYAITPEALSVSKRGTFNEPRNVALFLFRRVRRDSLKDIGAWFHIKKYSSVSSAIERLKARMEADRQLKRRVDALLEMFHSKGQGQT